MSYLALARKYRPQRLSELIGQDSLVQTLKNAISINRIHHAFIFTGTRGVGKTTTARIIALSLNCIGEDGNGKETDSPCLKCKNCLDTLNSSHPDVIEIDAASNTGVDSARDIIESSKYQPMIARYKIYIIDEVHMLSKSAFNALLKTLEEPNHFVKFIFATTEFRKIPITISSRCQKFFLKNLTCEELTLNLKNIIQKENIRCEEEALRLISEMAKGSARDSLSILDQAIGVSNGNIVKETIISMFSSGYGDFGYEILKNIFSNKIDDALKICNQISESGTGITFVLNDIIDIISKIMHSVATNSKDISTQDLILILGERVNIQILDRMWQVIAKSISYSNFINEKNVLQSLVIRLSFIAKLPTIDEIVSGLI